MMQPQRQHFIGRERHQSQMLHHDWLIEIGLVDSTHYRTELRTGWMEEEETVTGRKRR